MGGSTSYSPIYNLQTPEQDRCDQCHQLEVRVCLCQASVQGSGSSAMGPSCWSFFRVAGSRIRSQRTVRGSNAPTIFGSLVHLTRGRSSLLLLLKRATYYHISSRMIMARMRAIRSFMY